MWLLLVKTVYLYQQFLFGQCIPLSTSLKKQRKTNKSQYAIIFVSSCRERRLCLPMLSEYWAPPWRGVLTRVTALFSRVLGFESRTSSRFWTTLPPITALTQPSLVISLNQIFLWRSHKQHNKTQNYAQNFAKPFIQRLQNWGHLGYDFMSRNKEKRPYKKNPEIGLNYILHMCVYI